MNHPEIYILLSTFNGSKYLERQLNSIISQTYANWKLVIRDDGSSDDTLEIIERFVKKDGRIMLLKDNFGNLKSCQSFSALMNYVKAFANYVMFCDQDDIWKSEKVEISFEEIKLKEAAFGKNVSLLVYSSYQLMGEDGVNLSIKPPVFPSNLTVNLLLAENYVYGCTTIINKHLLEKAAPISKNAENHDYWIALVALVTNGNIFYINRTLLFYRQHQNNVSGSYKNATFVSRFMRLRENQSNVTINNRLKMFTDLFSQFNNDLSPFHNRIINNYIKYASIGGFRAIWYCLKMNIRKVSLLKTIPFYIGIWEGRKS